MDTLADPAPRPWLAAVPEFGRARAAATLFARDFAPQQEEAANSVAAKPAPSPAPSPAPGPSAADLVAARADGFARGHTAGIAEAEAGARARAADALAAIAARVEAMRAEAASRADRAAHEVAALLLASVGATLPALCARHGDAEVAAAARLILPAIRTETAIEVRGNPHALPALAAEIGRMDKTLAAAIRLTPTDALGPADLEVTWRDGAAARDTDAIWRSVLDAIGAALPANDAALTKHPADPKQGSPSRCLT